MKHSLKNSFLIIMILVSLIASGTSVAPVNALGQFTQLLGVPGLPSAVSNGYLNAVWGSDTNNIIAVGKGHSGIETATSPLIYQKIAGTWQDPPIALSPTTFNSSWTTATFQGVWGADATHAFAVGYGGTTTQTLPMASVWNGSTWTSTLVNLPTTGGFTYGYLEGIWGTGASDVYAVGYAGGGSNPVSPMVSKWNGTGWSSKTLALPSGWASGQLYDLWGYGPAGSAAVYAVGTGVKGSGSPMLYRSTDGGNNWTLINLPLPSGWTSGQLYDVWGRNASDFYVVGSADNGPTTVPLLYHWDGYTWSYSNPALATGWTSAELYGIWGASTGEVFAVGVGNNSGTKPLMYRKTSTGWAASSALPSGWSTGSFNGAIWGLNGTDVYVVGFGNNGVKDVPLFSHAVGDILNPGNVTNLRAVTGAVTGVDLTWTAPADDGTTVESGPVNSYIVKYSTADNLGSCDDPDGQLVNTNNLVPVMPGQTQTLIVTTGLVQGTQYYFSVCPLDDENRTGGYATVGPVTAKVNSVDPGTYEDTDSHWNYSGTWGLYNGSGPTNDTLHNTATVGASAELAFNGISFTLTFTKHSNRGSFDVYVDGTKVTTVNAYNSTVAWQQTYTSPTYTAGIHILKIVHAGGGTYIDVDAIQVVGPRVPVPVGTYEDTDSNWVYTGAWGVYNGSGPTNDTLHNTSTAGNSAELLFNGTKFILTFTKNSNRGSFDVYVDGTKVTTVSAYSSTLAWQQTYTSPTYTAGDHTVKIVHAGGGTYIDIDAIQIQGPPVPVPVGMYEDTNGNWTYSGTWGVYSGSGPTNNILHNTSTAGDYAELMFNGTKFVLVFTKNSNRGSFDVYVDGTKVTTVNAYSSTLAWQQTYNSPTYTAGNHTVRIVHAGGGTYIDIDAIAILGGTGVSIGSYEDTDSHWTYSGTWGSYNGSGPTNDTLRNTSTVGNYAQLVFNGAKFILTFTKNSNRGLFDVYVDGTKAATVSAYSPTLAWQQTYTSPTYPLGDHIVRIVHVGGGSYIDVDAIQILGVPVPVPIGTYEDTDGNWAYSGTWGIYSGSGPTNSTLHNTSTTGDSAELVFNGVRFILTFTKNSNRSSFDVYVDGTKVTTVSAYNPTLAWQQTYISPTYTAGDHIVRIVHAGAGGTYIDVDAIQILGPPVPVPAGTYEDTDSHWAYSGIWNVYNGSGPTNDTLHNTSTTGDYAELLFTGTKFTLTFTKHSNRGSFDVYVDGTKVTTVSAYNPTLVWQQTYTSPTYTAGNHTVRIVHAGAGGTYIDVDAIQIQ